VAKPVPDDPPWTAKDDSVALPGQLGLPGIRHSIGLARWWHLGVDVLWLLNGAVFYVLLFATGQWPSHPADQLGRLSQCRIGGHSVPFPDLADRQHLG
jgi:hypothetical protein